MTSPDGNAGRFLLALGGFLGFSAAFVSALQLGHGDVSSALLRASIGMVVGALLMKVLLGAIYSSAREARGERLKAATAAAAARKEQEEAAEQPSSASH